MFLLGTGTKTLKQRYFLLPEAKHIVNTVVLGFSKVRIKLGCNNSNNNNKKNKNKHKNVTNRWVVRWLQASI